MLLNEWGVKMNRMSKRFLSLLLGILLCCSLITTAAFAVDEPANGLPYGITSTDKENEITVSQLGEDSTELNDIKEEAAPIGYGHHIISVDEDGVLPVPTETESGYCRSPFTLMSEKSIAAFTMNAPELNQYETQWKEPLGLGFVLAVEDNASDYVAFYPPEEEDNDTLTFEIPVRKEGVTCAVLLTPGVTTPYASLDENELETEDDPNDVATHHYTWKFTIDIGNQSVFKYMIGQSSIQILSPEGIAVVADSVKLESDFFEEIDPASIRRDGTGLYTIPLTVKEEYIVDNGTLGQNITEEGEKAAEKGMTFSFDIDISSSVSPGEFLISTKLTVPLPAGGGAGAPLVANAPLIVGEVVAFVSITPADMTIYEGGTAGYDGVVDEDGNPITSNSFPEPLFKIELPKSINGDPTVLCFTNQTTGKSWNVVKAGEDSDGTAYYRLVNTDASGTPIRVQFIDDQGKVTESDTVDLTDEVYDTYDIAIFSAATDSVKVTVKDPGSNPYYVSRNLGKLIVRAVEKETGAISEIVDTAPTTKLDPSTATAVEPAGTTYTLNDTDVQLPADHGASLLFDDIIESDGEPRVEALENAVDTKLGTTNGTRHYVAKYLDLVDANNGNAWISSSKGTDIYWGYPATTDKNTNFTLVHFKDLHRDGNNSGFNLDDIDSDNVDVLTAEEGDIENTDNGIKFHVGKGGFSPFVLVWETAAEEPDPGTDPNPGGGGGDSHSDPTGNLTISLGGNGGNEDFIFTVIFTDEDGDELENNFYYNGDYTGTIGSGDEITLTGGDKIVIRNLPEGTRYEVIIETADGYTATSTGAEGVIRTSGNEAAFSVTPTVVLADPSITGVTRRLNTTDHMAYLSGYPGGTFGPDNSMTRAEVAQMFYALLLNKDVTITKTFSDVPADAWYATAVNTLASLGMVSGDPDGAFRPNDPITRAEFCVIALAFAYEPENAVCYFGDVSRSDWFYTYVAQAASYGWIGGYTNGNFGPNDRITRAQVTTIVNNMLGRAADRDYVIDHQADLVQFTDLTRAHWGYFQIMEATNAHNYTKSNGTESWR